MATSKKAAAAPKAAAKKAVAPKAAAPKKAAAAAAPVSDEPVKPTIESMCSEIKDWLKQTGKHDKHHLHHLREQVKNAIKAGEVDTDLTADQAHKVIGDILGL